jgi:hypothetical protein
MLPTSVPGFARGSPLILALLLFGLVLVIFGRSALNPTNSDAMRSLQGDLAAMQASVDALTSKVQGLAAATDAHAAATLSGFAAAAAAAAAAPLPLPSLPPPPMYLGDHTILCYARHLQRYMFLDSR